MLLCPPRPPRALPTRWRPSNHRFVSLHRPSFSFCGPLHHHHLHYQQRRDSLNQLQPRPSARDSALSSVLCSSPRFSTHATASATTTMDESVKKHYLADSPPSVVRLEIKQHFDKLEDPKLRKYAHYISRFVSFLFVVLVIGNRLTGLGLRLKVSGSRYVRSPRSQNRSTTSLSPSTKLAMATGPVSRKRLMSARSTCAFSWNTLLSSWATAGTTRALAMPSSFPDCRRLRWRHWHLRHQRQRLRSRRPAALVGVFTRPRNRVSCTWAIRKVAI